MGIEKKVYSFRFNEDMVDRLRACAEAENRTLSKMIETILLQYLSKNITYILCEETGYVRG